MKLTGPRRLRRGFEFRLSVFVDLSISVSGFQGSPRPRVSARISAGINYTHRGPRRRRESAAPHFLHKSGENYHNTVTDVRIIGYEDGQRLSPDTAEGPRRSRDGGPPGPKNAPCWSATSCSPTDSLRSTIGAGGLNFRVRNGTGCTSPAMVADQRGAFCCQGPARPGPQGRTARNGTSVTAPDDG